jgi:hypothetical protein
MVWWCFRWLSPCSPDPHGVTPAFSEGNPGCHPAITLKLLNRSSQVHVPWGQCRLPVMAAERADSVPQGTLLPSPLLNLTKQ